MPTHTPTVPRPWIRSPPRTRPKMVQPIARWRETSSSISVGRTGLPLRARGVSGSPPGATAARSVAPSAAVDSAGSVASLVPVMSELSDTVLDLIEGDMTQPPRGDDLLTIYH